MAPDKKGATGVLFENDAEMPDLGLSNTPKMQTDNSRRKYAWGPIIGFTYLHISAIYGGYLFIFSAKWQTNILAFLLYVMSVLGITAGAHRLWTHRSYKAKWPLRVILATFYTLSHQESIIHWTLDHRMHHKYSDTDADPHNSTRGFLFAHIGWLLVYRHPEFEIKSKGIDMSDMYADPIVTFQEKHYVILVFLACFVLPTVIPVCFWSETWTNAFFVDVMFRYAFTLHVTWLVNSAAHMWGYRPYEKNIQPTDNITAVIFTLGEGFHNYHHTFPWDYKAAEFGNFGTNFTTSFINFFAKFGWAYDLKTISSDIIRNRAQRTGDGSHKLWGWGDKDHAKEEVNSAIRIYPKDE